jgi:hypothetical protein
MQFFYAIVCWNQLVRIMLHMLEFHVDNILSIKLIFYLYNSSGIVILTKCDRQVWII